METCGCWHKGCQVDPQCMKMIAWDQTQAAGEDTPESACLLRKLTIMKKKKIKLYCECYWLQSPQNLCLTEIFKDICYMYSLSWLHLASVSSYHDNKIKNKNETNKYGKTWTHHSAGMLPHILGKLLCNDGKHRYCKWNINKTWLARIS